VYSETKQEQIENIQEISYNGKSIPLKSERLRLVFKKVENQLAELYDPANQSDNKKTINNFLKFVNTLEDSQIVIKKEKAEESKKSEQSGQVYNLLIQYTVKLKLKAAVDRNLLQAKLLANRLNVASIFASKLESHNVSVRPQNIVRFFEKALKSMKSQRQTLS
jgi:hypothetical protein